MDNKLLLDIRDIKKSYKISKEKNLEVLKGINLQINREEIVAIVGKSGAGKSTLLHLIGTLDNPDSGKIFFDGTDVYAMKEKELSKFRNSKIGFIFQFHHLLPEFTAIENVMIPSMIEGKEDRAKAENLLKEVGIEERINHRPNAVSYTHLDVYKRQTLNKGMLTNTKYNKVLFIKGTDQNKIADVSGIKNVARLGEFNLEDDGDFGGIVIGFTLADQMLSLIHI